MKIKIKKIVLPSIVLLLMLTIIFAGCGQKPDNQGTSSTSTASKPLYLSIGGSAQGGTSYIQAGGMATLIGKYVSNTSATVEATTGAVENARLVASNNAQIGFILADTAVFASNGQDPFKQKLTNLRVLMIGQPAVIHFVAKKDAPINSVADFKGKRIGVSAPGSAMALVGVPAILKAYGLSYNDVEERMLSANETTDALRNNSIDMGTYFAGDPVAAVSEIATTVGIKMISLDDKSMDKVIAENPYFIKTTIKGGTYKGVDQDVKTLADPIVIAVNADVPEDVVYNIVKALWTHLDEWTAIHPGAAEFTPEVTAKDYKGILPLHPGVEKYLKEKGLLK